MPSSMNSRNHFLDMAKGVAIILVVIGHTIQYRNPDFDNQLWFRVIYSFHMPLFIFLSGAVASLWFNPEAFAQKPLLINLKALSIRTYKAFTRLVIPFVCWGLIAAFIQKTEQPFISILVNLFRRPDTGLWFLICIFYCIFLLNVFQAIFCCFQSLLSKIGRPLPFKFSSNLVQILLFTFIWLLIQGRLGNGSGFYSAKTNFIYFLLGLIFFKFLMEHLKTYVYLGALLLFIWLAPLWHRTNTHNLLDASSLEPFAPQLVWFPFLTALSGTLALVFLVQKLEGLNIPKLNESLSFLGKLSLGIYALHYYLLELNPPVIVPLAICVIFSVIVLKIPVLRTALLGETGK